MPVNDWGALELVAMAWVETNCGAKCSPGIQVWVRDGWEKAGDVMRQQPLRASQPVRGECPASTCMIDRRRTWTEHYSPETISDRLTGGELLSIVVVFHQSYPPMTWTDPSIPAMDEHYYATHIVTSLSPSLRVYFPLVSSSSPAPLLPQWLAVPEPHRAQGHGGHLLKVIWSYIATAYWSVRKLPMQGRYCNDAGG